MCRISKMCHIYKNEMLSFGSLNSVICDWFIVPNNTKTQ